jgi:hypothetical protein
VQTTLRDVDDITEIDSSSPPRPEMHELTIAEAIDSGWPTVVAFATPAFCQSRVCGPLMDAVVDPLFERYADRVVFVHVEPFDLAKARGGELIPVPAVDEWGLQTEPWLFIIDQEGRVAGKFEAIVALHLFPTGLAAPNGADGPAGRAGTHSVRPSQGVGTGEQELR